MKLLDAVLFRGFFLLEAGPVLCHKLHSWLLPCSSPGPFHSDPASQQLWQLIWSMHSYLRASCKSSTALSHLLFPKDLNELLTASPFPNYHGASTPSQTPPCNVHRGTPDRVLHIQAMASQTKHPAPNKGTRRKSNERRAALKAACAKAALLFIQIRTLLNQFDRSFLENI